MLTGCDVQANVMLSYPIDEAETLLSTKFKAATQSLKNCEEDLDFLREQVTVCLVLRFAFFAGGGFANAGNIQTMEVAVARVYNWDVVQKRKEKEEEDKLAKEKKKNKDVSPGG